MSNMREETHTGNGSSETPRKKAQHKIIYVGNFKLPFTTENDVKKSFEAIGWEVKAIQEDEITKATIEQILQIENEYDFILYTRTWMTTEVLWRELLKRTNKITVAFHLDLYLGLERGKNLDQDSFFQCQEVFSADGGHQELFASFGVKHHWLPP